MIWLQDLPSYAVLRFISREARLLVIACLPFWFTSCSAGIVAVTLAILESGSGGSGNAPPSVKLVSFAQVTPDPELGIGAYLEGDSRFEYLLIASGSHRASIEAEYRVEGDPAFHPASPAPGSEATTGLEATPDGKAHTFIWDTRRDLGDGLVRANLCLRTSGNASETGLLVVDNTSPPEMEVIAVETDPGVPEPGRSLTGRVTIRFALRDRESDSAGVQLGFISKGVAVPLRPGGDPNPFKDLSTAADRWVEHAFAWDSSSDIPQADEGVLRLRSFDSKPGAPLEVGVRISNTPPSLILLSSASRSRAGMIEFEYSVADPGEDGFDLRGVDYSLLGPAGPFQPATLAEGGEPREDLSSTQGGSVHGFLWNSHFDIDQDLRSGRLDIPVTARAVVRLRIRDRETGAEVSGATRDFVLNEKAIATVAGSSPREGLRADTASLSGASALALDRGGNLYIADTGHHRVRVVDAGSGLIEAFAGNGLARFSGDGNAAVEASLNEPRGLAIDGGGDIFIADTGNHRIRRVNFLGVIQTVAGDGTMEFAGDGGKAIGASLQSPQGIAFDGQGNLLIADSGNQRVRRMDPQGNILTIAGGGAPADGIGDGLPAVQAQLASPAAVAVRGSVIYIVDEGMNRIRAVDAQGTIATVAGGGTPDDGLGDGSDAAQSRLSRPAGIAFHPTLGLIFGDGDNGRIRGIRGGLIETIAGGGSSQFLEGPALEAEVVQPRGLLVDGEGGIFFIDSSDGDRVWAIEGDMLRARIGLIGLGGVAIEQSLNKPADIDVDSDSNLYILDRENQRVRRVEAASGRIETLAGTAGRRLVVEGPAKQVPLIAADGIAVDRAGGIFVADTGNHRIRFLDPSAEILTNVAGEQEEFIRGDVDADGQLTEEDSKQLLNYLFMDQNLPIDCMKATDADDNGIIDLKDAITILNVVFLSESMPKPFPSCGIDFTWDELDCKQTSFCPGLSGDSPLETRLGSPRGLAFSPAGNLYFAQTDEHRITMLDREQGKVAPIAGTGIGGFSGDGGPAGMAQLFSPHGIATDKAGNILIADAGNHRVRRVDAATMRISTVAGNGTQGFLGDGGSARQARLNAPQGVAFDDAGNIYIADTGNHRIRRVNRSGNIATIAGGGPQTEDLGDGKPPDQAFLSSPRGIRVDALGNVWIADTGNDRVRRFWIGK